MHHHLTSYHHDATAKFLWFF